MANTKNFDVLILGGGIAGMTAAIYGAKANYKCAILETNITGGLANSTYTIENFPGFIEEHGMELMQKIRNQVDHLGVHTEEAVVIKSFDISGGKGELKKVVIDDCGDEVVFTGRAIIIATGREPLKLDVPTESEHIHYCAICDGPPYKDKTVLLVGGGNSSFDEGLYLMQLGVKELHVIEIMDRFFAAQSTQDKLLGLPGVKGHKSTKCVDVKLNCDGRLCAAVLEDTQSGERRELAVDGVFVFLGQRPQSDMFKGLINMDKAGYIEASEGMETNIPGVFSAGDINRKSFRQLTTAAADGTIAALMVDRYLRS